LATDPNDALSWLRHCWALLVGPTFYSVEGVHSVARANLQQNARQIRNKAPIFPKELAGVLCEFFALTRHTAAPKRLTLDDCLAIHSNTALARSCLHQLAEEVSQGTVNINTVEDLKRLIVAAEKREKFVMRTLRVLFGVVAGAATARLDGATGFAVGSGVTVAMEYLAEPFERQFRSVTRSNVPVFGMTPAVVSVFELDDELLKLSRGMIARGTKH
jgi:hypothetical protein